MQRACVIGFYYNEQKQDEIANELSIPVNTVKSHLNRAKAKIKEAVGDTEQKQGIKLYSFAPFMLLFFLKDTEAYAAELSIPAMSAELSSAIGGGSAKGSTAMAGIKTTGVKAAGMAIKTKVIAGLVTGALVAGVVAGVALYKEKPAKTEILVEVSQDSAEESSIEEITNEAAVEETEINISENNEDSTGVENEQEDMDFWSKNGLTVCRDSEIAVPYMIEFKDQETGNPIGMELDGTSIIKNNNVIKFTGALVTYDNGYKDITITYEAISTALFLYENEYATYDYSIKRAYGSPDVFDKYTGLKLKTDGDSFGSGIKNNTVTNLVNDEEIQIGYIKELKWDSDWGDYLPYNSDLNIPECLEYQDFYSTLICDMKFHVPEDYDGLVIAFAKIGADRFANKDEEIDDTIYYMFEPDRNGNCFGADEYYYFPVSDLLEQFK